MSQSKQKLSPKALELPAGATGEEVVTISSFPGGFAIDVKLAEWVALLQLAAAHGWKPMGTTIVNVPFWEYRQTRKAKPMGDVIGEILDGMEAANREWDGCYTEDAGQLIDYEDAQNLLAALQRALPSITDEALKAYAREMVSDIRGVDGIWLTSNDFAEFCDDYQIEAMPVLETTDKLPPEHLAELTERLRQEGWNVKVAADDYLDLRWPQPPPAAGSATRELYENMQRALRDSGAGEEAKLAVGLVLKPVTVAKALEGKPWTKEDLPEFRMLTTLSSGGVVRFKAFWQYAAEAGNGQAIRKR